MLSFCHLQKTGGQTMRAILRKNFGPRHCDFYVNHNPTLTDWQLTRRCYARLLSIGGHGVWPTDDFRKVFPSARCYTFVRNPISRCVSNFFYGKRLSANPAAFPNFTDYVRSHPNVQTTMLIGEPNGEKAIEMLETRFRFVGLLERYDESLLLWKQWSGYDWLDLNYQKVNVGKKDPEKEEILADPRNQGVLEEMHQEDMLVYRHVTEVMYPRQQADYGPSLKADLLTYLNSNVPRTNATMTSFLGRLKRNFVYKPTMRMRSSRRAA